MGKLSKFLELCNAFNGELIKSSEESEEQYICEIPLPSDDIRRMELLRKIKEPLENLFDKKVTLEPYCTRKAGGDLLHILKGGGEVDLYLGKGSNLLLTLVRKTTAGFGFAPVTTESIKISGIKDNTIGCEMSYSEGELFFTCDDANVSASFVEGMVR